MAKQYSNIPWVPLPSSPTTLVRRGFHQTQVILSAAQIPYQELLVSKDGQGKQALKSRAERLVLEERFVIAPALCPPFPPEVILFDDIYTTGATLYAASQTLQQQNIKVIGSVTLAR